MFRDLDWIETWLGKMNEEVMEAESFGISLRCYKSSF
jgi:hypothetical protein